MNKRQRKKRDTPWTNKRLKKYLRRVRYVQTIAPPVNVGMSAFLEAAWIAEGHAIAAAQFGPRVFRGMEAYISPPDA